MSNLAAQRCFHHARREAAARCPSCSRFYCRECITEHDDRVICASCLRLETQQESAASRSWQGVLSAAQVVVAVLALWLLFYLLGRGLLILPDAFHDGSIWGDG